MALPHVRIGAALLLTREMQTAIPNIQFLTCQTGRHADVLETLPETAETRTPGNGGPGDVAGRGPGAFLLSHGAVGFFRWCPVGLKPRAAQGGGQRRGLTGSQAERAQVGERGQIQDALYPNM